MPPQKLDPDLQASFVSETSDLLDDLEPALIAYRKEQDESPRAELIGRIFRHFHSIKGSAGFLGYAVISALTHESEGFLEPFRRNARLRITDRQIDLLCRVVDRLRHCVASLPPCPADQAADAAIESLLADLRQHSLAARKSVVSQTGPVSAPATAPQAPPAGPPDPAGSAEAPKTEGMDTEKRRTLAIANFRRRFIAEAVELLDQCEQVLLQGCQASANRPELAGEALRSLHSFKGNSGFMRLADLERLAHRIEEEVGRWGRAPDGDPSASTAVCDTLLQYLDLLRQGVADYERGGKGQIPDIDSYIALLDTAAGPAAAPQAGPGAEAGAPPDRVQLPRPPRIDLGGDLAAAAPPAAPGPPSAAPAPAPAARPPAASGHPAAAPGAAAPVPGRPAPARPPAASDTEAATRPATGMFRTETAPPPVPPPRDGQAPAAKPVRPAGGGGGAAPAPAALPRNDIRVDLTKLDAILDLVGELVIAEAMVSSHPVVAGADNESLERAVHQLRRVASELQNMSMSVRMVPLASTFRRMIRLVFDLSTRAGKQVNLEMEGEDTEVDKTVIEHIADPLVHVLRNAVDHGIETPAERRAAGKPETGRVVIEGRHEGGEVWIIVTDDGRGLSRDKLIRKGVERGLVQGDGADLADAQVHQLIFEPGFSTAAQVTDISGRGVGLDVVKKNIEKLNGKIDVRTRPGEGMSVVLKIPLTLAIIDGMLVRSGQQRYIVPLLAIRESLRPTRDMIHLTPDGQELVRLRDSLIPVVRLHEVFGRAASSSALEDGILMVVDPGDGTVVAIFADELMGQQETVIKGMSGWMRHARGVSGATIFGDGEVGLILNIGEIVKRRPGRVPGEARSTA